MKRIATDAYQALREALAVITWNKRPFETLLRTALRDHGELLVGLNFDEPKRKVADELVDRLVERESRYQQVTLQLMLEVSSTTRFPNIEQIKTAEDRQLRLAEARAAVERLQEVTAKYSTEMAERERVRAQREALRVQQESVRRFADEVDDLKQRFLTLQASGEPRPRGYAFEKLLGDLFRLFDMEPRLAYSLELEQIDGSLSFDTDDYIIEARWRQEQVDRGQADIFAMKVRRKGKNALGLMISVNGFSRAALEQYREGTPFVTLDGGDLFLVLEQRVRIDDLLKAKRRHANETGSCYLPARELLVQ